MMKKYIAMFLCIGMSYFSLAQKTDVQKLTSTTWLLTEEIVNGESKQPATEKDIHLDFGKDGKWKATYALHGATSGTWQFDKNGKLVMTLNGKKNADLVLADGEHLEIVLVEKNGTVRWKWETPK